MAVDLFGSAEEYLNTSCGKYKSTVSAISKSDDGNFFR